jgi:hypothetical protein
MSAIYPDSVGKSRHGEPFCRLESEEKLHGRRLR